ncbi:Nitrite reductase [NAD(P)H] small subunit [hydrothermal vent metagenome]|uniref:Nitrite reductase [NAD(P)H] small subunit n=1 Tax=hydrothermal vent metagenome TaxID=652676 RepID=A0A3B1E3G6_9ZZZZ
MDKGKGGKYMNTQQVNLGSIDQIGLGHGHCFIVEGKKIAVFRLRGGELKAIEHLCPHDQGPLADGMIGDGKVVCPLHGHKFDLSTGEGSEGRECVKVFKIEEKDGQIFVEVF